nr:MAG TPA: hypothetical protein [Caudoviricetes sp.]
MTTEPLYSIIIEYSQFLELSIKSIRKLRKHIDSSRKG